MPPAVLTRADRGGIDEPAPDEEPGLSRLGRSEVEAQLRVEELCAALASLLIGMRTTDFEGSVGSALRRVADFFGVEQCSLIMLEGHSVTALHGKGDAPQWPVVAEGTEPMEWYLEPLKAGQAVRVEAGQLAGLAGAPRSHLCAPLVAEEGTLGGLALSCFSADRLWTDSLAGHLQRIAGLFAPLVSRVRAEGRWAASPPELLHEASDAEARSQAIHFINRHDRIIGQSDALREVLAKISQVASTDSTVLICGETGTGKELIARAIHEASARRGRPMVKVNCAALPAALVESELFGREKGAYTGALSKQIGRFELADQSTIFLDEIGDLPLELQGKLLRVLQEGEFERLGSPKTLRVNARVIAATNRNLAKAVDEGAFREDLYYRLNVFSIQAPPLREHPEDIPLLVWSFVKQFGESMSRAIDTIPRPLMEALQNHPWPGNVRQLRNVIEHGMIISTGKVLRAELPKVENMGGGAPKPMTLMEVERNHILSVLDKTRWKVSGKGGAAEVLGMKPTTLESRMEKLGIRRMG